MAAGTALTAASAAQTALRDYATAALASGESALNNLGNTEYPYITSITAPIGTFTPYAVVLPSVPSAITISAQPETVALAIPDKPTRPTLTIPTAPTIVNPNVPSRPSTTMPSFDNVSVPSISGVTLPDVPIVNISDLAIDPPADITISPGTWNFSVSNILITDDPLVLAMIDRLKDNIQNGGTGLSAAVEADIWARDLERNEQQLQDSTDKVTSMWAKKGFSLPDGLLANSLAEVQTEYMNKLLDRSREIAIKQAELEQVNLFKSLELGISLVFKLVEELIRYEDLVFRTQEATAKYANEFIRLQIEAHNSMVEVYKIRVQAYELTIRANLAKVEVYRAQIQGELAKVNVDEVRVRMYATQIEAAVAKYKGSLEANQILTQIFNSEVQAVLAEAQINESIVKAYAESVRAVIAETEIYKSEIEGMTAELGVEKAKVDVNIAQVTAWAKGVDAEIANLNSAIEIYKTSGQLNVSVADMANKSAEVILRAQIEQAKVLVAVADAVSRSQQGAASGKVEAAKGVAAAAASLTAGAMAGVTAQSTFTYNENMAGTVT